MARNAKWNLNNGAGEGIVYWYPEAVNVACCAIYNNGATALFDNSRNALPGLSTFGVTLVPGDVDHDGQVTLSDFDVIRDSYGSGPNARRINGDLNGDGVVDLSDFMLWKDLYSAAGGAGAAAARLGVPEPASAVLILIGALLSLGLGHCALPRSKR